MPTRAIMKAATGALKEQNQLETIKRLRDALKMIQVDASRPPDATRSAMIKRIAEKALKDSEQYD